MKQTKFKWIYVIIGVLTFPLAFVFFLMEAFEGFGEDMRDRFK